MEKNLIWMILGIIVPAIITIIIGIITYRKKHLRRVKVSLNWGLALGTSFTGEKLSKDALSIKIINTGESKITFGQPCFQTEDKKYVCPLMDGYGRSAFITTSGEPFPRTLESQEEETLMIPYVDIQEESRTE